MKCDRNSSNTSDFSALLPCLQALKCLDYIPDPTVKNIKYQCHQNKNLSNQYIRCLKLFKN